MGATLRSISHLPLHRETWFHTASSSISTMSTRTLPTPPPEGPGATQAEATHTAPPTTGTEESAAPANPPPVQPQPTQTYTIYRQAFPIFASKAIDKDWSGLAALAELHDLRVCPRSHPSNRRPPNHIPRNLQTEHDDDVSRLLLTAPLVLSYLILDDMYDFNARNAGHFLKLCDQTSRPVCVDPPPPTTPTPPRGGRTL